MSVTSRPKRRSVRPAQIARAVDEGRESLDLYLDEISRVPLLTRDEEMELARKAFRGNIAAQERLARHNVRFVVSVAKKFQNRGVPLVDLIGEGNLGLMTAARAASTARFSPEPIPIPIMLLPASRMIVFTSAKSRLMSPGTRIRSEIP